MKILMCVYCKRRRSPSRDQKKIKRFPSVSGVTRNTFSVHEKLCGIIKTFILLMSSWHFVQSSNLSVGKRKCVGFEVSVTNCPFVGSPREEAYLP